jgi:SAM-dependent methyltransferase
MPIERTNKEPMSLPDYYEAVADDMITFCDRTDGVWMDLGSGVGGLGLAVLEKVPEAIMVLVDADAEVLRRTLHAAAERGLAHRVVGVLGSADRIPMPDGAVDALISRGSFCFWQERAQGVREVCRILRPGAKARLGGGLGSGYPQWARREFIRKKLESVAANGPDASRRFVDGRRPETFRRAAVEAGLSSFEVISNDGLGPDEPFTGVGTWLQFSKEAQHGR